MKPKAKQNKKQDSQRVPRIFGLGQLDLELILALPKEFADHFDLTTINTVKDLKSLLNDHKGLWDFIQLQSSSSLINIFLYINKTYNLKSFTEFIDLNEIIYTEDDDYMKEIIKYVTEHNYLFIQEANLMKCPSKVSFTLKCGKTFKKTFSIGKTVEEPKTTDNTNLKMR